jgi:hypothetical protein
MHSKDLVLAACKIARTVLTTTQSANFHPGAEAVQFQSAILTSQNDKTSQCACPCARPTRLTNAFLKKVDSHEAAVAPHFMFYNFGRTHQTSRITLGMAAGVSDHVWSLEEIVKADGMSDCNQESFEAQRFTSRPPQSVRNTPIKSLQGVPFWNMFFAQDRYARRRATIWPHRRKAMGLLFGLCNTPRI